MAVLLSAGTAAAPLLCLRSTPAPATHRVVAAAGPTVADLASRRFDATISRSANRDLPDPVTTTTTSPPPPQPTPRPRVTAPPRKVAAVRAAPVTRPRPAPPRTTTPPPSPPPPPAHQETGKASWYDGADGNCAFNRAPIGTVLTVTNTANGRSTTCRVASRGPFNGRVIDLTRSTFARLASTSQGVIDVRVTW